MNRNQMYNYLKELGMYPIIVRHNRKSYHMEFRPNKELNQTDCDIKTDWGYLKGIESIHLFQYGIVLYSKYELCEIYILYNTIKTFEVSV